MESVSVENVNNKKNMMFILLAFGLAMVTAGVGATLAYLTKGTEKRANPFTFGNVSIELIEEEWENLPPEDKVIYPEKTIPKDPLIKNTGKNDAYVYMEVKVPMATVRTYNENGSIEDAEMQELFTFVKNDGWKIVKEPEESSDGDNYKVYLYVYESPLPSGEKTSSLFDEVQVIPMLEGEDELKMNTSIEIPITAYAIQVDSDFISENLDFKDIFEKYIKSED